MSNENKKNITFVALEEVTDPRNIGSIIRSATSFNIAGIIVKERSFPSESKLLYKSASGCMEYINIFEVSNINTALRFLKTKNFWTSGFDKNGDKNFIDHHLSKCVVKHAQTRDQQDRRICFGHPPTRDFGGGIGDEANGNPIGN